MKTKLLVFLAVVCLALALATYDRALGNSPSSTPTGPFITFIEINAVEVVVTVEIPKGLGLKKLTLESRSRIGAGAWRPRAVERLTTDGGTVTFRLPKSADLEVLRVRGDTQEALPTSFYQGTNSFSGSATTGYGTEAPVERGGAYDVLTLSLDPSAVTDLVLAPTAVTAAREVVESDIWKVHGDRLFFFNQYRGLQVIDLSRPEAPAVLGTLALPAAGEQMYVLNDRHVLLLARDGCGSSSGEGSQGLVVDVADGTPRVVAAAAIPGYVQESRLVGSALYVASQTYRRVALGPEGSGGEQWEWGSVVSSFDLADPTVPVARNTLWYPGYGNVIMATDRFLFVVGQNYSDWVRSGIQVVDISAPDGTMQARSTVRPAGRVADKFKMNLAGDVFTVISEDWGWSTGRRVSVVETFSLQNAAAPAKLGQLEVGNGEALFATRFDGDRVYIVTFRRIDPLWVVDLRDPARPKVSGELQVPGWSTYIQPLGDRLVSVGIDNTNGWRVAVSLFDVRDPTQPGLLSRVPLGENHSWSEANYNEKAFTVLPEAGLILVPYQGYTTNGYASRVQLIDLNADSLVARGTIEHRMAPRRATLHRDHVVSISGRELLSVNVMDRDQPVVRADVELSWPVNRVLLAGDYLIEVSAGAGWETQSDPVLRVVRAADPDRLVGQWALTNGLAVLGATVRDGQLYVVQGDPAMPWMRLYQVELNTNSTAQATNAPNLFLTVFDLSQLPELRPVGQVGVATAPLDWMGQLEAVWPKPGLVVWTAGQTDAYGYRWAAMDVAPPVGRYGHWWWPWYSWGGGGRLFAFDVTSADTPRVVAETDLGATNEWTQFSRPIALNGSVYLSHQDYETQDVGFRTNLYTQTTYTYETNVVVSTNIIRIPYQVTRTNTGVVTNLTSLGVLYRPFEAVDSAWVEALALGRGLAAGAHHGVALGPGGSAWTWGENADGQLGDGANADRAAPALVPGLGSVSAVAAGGRHSLALQADGAAWAWGADMFGQLGDGPPKPDPFGIPMPEVGTNLPVQVVGLAQAVQLAGGLYHSLSLTADGTVWAWGDNSFGALGDGTTTRRSSPGLVPDLAGVGWVGAGGWHGLAVQTNGMLWTWGRNHRGQLGDGTVVNRAVPVPAGVGDAVTAAGGLAHSLVLRADGSVWACGANEVGQLGDGSPSDRNLLAPVPGLGGVVAVAAGSWHSLALREDGTIWAWGRNQAGQLGDGTRTDRRRPVQVAQLSGALAVAAAGDLSLAATAEGALWCWGGGLPPSQPGQGEPFGITNLVPFTNIVTLVEYEVRTNYTSYTNVVAVPLRTTITNITPIRIWIERHYLDVVDYSDPLLPTVWPPTSIPGVLKGISHQGALVYTAGMHWKDDGRTAQGYWLDACAFDGVQAFLIDSLSLDGYGENTVLQPDGAVLLARRTDEGRRSQLEAWRLSEVTGRFASLGVKTLSAWPSGLTQFGGLLAVQLDRSIELYDATQPATLIPLNSADTPGCLWPSLTGADGALGRGLWIPLYDYGVFAIGLQ